MELTKKQYEAMKAIQEYINENKFPPSVRELGEILGKKSPSTTSALLNVLERKGYIHISRNKTRAIVVLKGVDERNTNLHEFRKVVDAADDGDENFYNRLIWKICAMSEKTEDKIRAYFEKEYKDTGDV